MAKKLHVVPPVESRVFLRARTGETYVYDSYAEFLHYLNSYVVERLGKNFKETRWLHFEMKLWTVHFVAESNGIIIDPNKVKTDWSDFWQVRKRVNRTSWWYRINNRIYEYRYDPVPMIHKHNWHKGSYYKRLRTTQERRISLSEKEDGVRWRCKRNFHNLPNSWDDIPRGRSGKNWKNFRKTQWR